MWALRANAITGQSLVAVEIYGLGNILAFLGMLVSQLKLRRRSMRINSMANDMKNYGAIQACSIGDMRPPGRVAYGKTYSARRPKGCRVKDPKTGELVEFCLDCPKPECSFGRDY